MRTPTRPRASALGSASLAAFSLACGCGPGTGPRLAGTFITGWEGPATRAAWKREFADMKALGFDVLIVQYAAYGLPGEALYPGCSAGLPAPRGDVLGEMLAAARETGGFSVFLGLGYRTDWKYGGTESSQGYDRLARFNMGVADDLQRRYGGMPGVAGWYVPQEIDGQRSWGPASTSPRTPLGRLLAHYYRPLMAHLKRLAPAKPVMIAPFFGWDAMPPAEFGRWWSVLMNSCPADILALQDGIGVRHAWLDPAAAGAKGAAPWCSARAYIGAAAEACRASGKSLWLDLEVFRHAGTKSLPATFEPARLGGLLFPGVRQQLEQEGPLLTARGPYGDRIVCYAYADDMSLHREDVRAAAAAGLHRSYADWLRRRRAVRPAGARPTR